MTVFIGGSILKIKEGRCLMEKTRGLTIRRYKTDDYEEFSRVFFKYFRDALKLDVSFEDARDICRDIEERIGRGICVLDIALVDEKIGGFISYQVDSCESNWNYREGDGCILEAYVDNEYRELGLGKLLNKGAEAVLWRKRIGKIYLTSDEEAVGFWERCGYVLTGDICGKNQCKVMEKGRLI